MAASLNRVMLIGRLGQDPELKYLPSGDAVVNFSIATDESYTDRATGRKVDKAEWHKIVAFGKTAELCAGYLSKGRLVYVEGSLSTRKWQAQDGGDRYTTEIKAQRVNFLDSKGDQEDEPRAPQPRQQRRAPRRDDDMGPAFPTEAIGMEDVPF